MECSKPRATKHEMGRKIPRILPATELEAMALQTARQTSQLHRTPLATATEKGMLHLATARPTAALRKAERPGLAEASAGEPPPTTVISSAPMPIRQPAAKPSTRVFPFEKPALALDAPTSALYTAGGGCTV